MRRCFKYFPSIKKSVCNQRIICAAETRGRSFRFGALAPPAFRCIFAGENVAAAEVLRALYKALAFSRGVW